jgi:hypothetical protein
MDRLAAELERQGHPTFRQNLARDGRMGRMVRFADSEICFGIEDDDRTVIVTDYRRVEAASGIRPGFRAIVQLVEFIKARPELGLTRLHGLIRPDRTASALPAERLAAGYRRLGGRFEKTVRGEDWLTIDIADYQPLRSRRKTRLDPVEGRAHA